MGITCIPTIAHCKNHFSQHTLLLQDYEGEDEMYMETIELFSNGSLVSHALHTGITYHMNTHNWSLIARNHLSQHILLLQDYEAEDEMFMETIELFNDGSGLGFGIVGVKDIGIVVKTILPGGTADKVSV